VIFVTVGTELPFDRLVRTVEQWAGATKAPNVFAQIGLTTYRPASIRYQEFIEPEEYTRLFTTARVVVSHAGMGTILLALEYGKPLIVLPRLASLREHRNDHQLATSHWLVEAGKVYVASNESDLTDALNRLSEIEAKPRIGPYANEELLEAIHNFISSS
jgi:UDP-N-acetylglucosamine transferase subunit ALG13